MIRRPPRSTRTDTLFPYTTLFRSLPSPFPQALGDFSAPFISETQIRRGDTLAALLQRLRIQERGLQPFLVQNKDARSIYKLYPGRSVQAAPDKDGRPEERRVGKEWGIRARARWWPSP